MKFARKTSSGRYVSLSREDMDLMNYTVRMPPTPDSQLNDEAAAAAGDRFGSTGIYAAGKPPLPGENRGVTPCAMPECDGSVEKDEHGRDVNHCECGYGYLISMFLSVSFMKILVRTVDW